MAFIRYKTVKGRRYYQLVHNFRENGVHCQEVLCHFGPHDSIDAAIEAERRRIAPALEYYEALASKWRSTAAYKEMEMEELGFLEITDEAEAQRKSDELWNNPEDREEWRRAYHSLALHEARAKAASNEDLAAARRARLDKLLKAKARYF
jgi:hypothetical protein